jgi:hypothetical protein
MPFIPLLPAAVNSLHSVVAMPMPIVPSARQPKLLSLDQPTAIHQVIRLVALARHTTAPSPDDCHIGIFHLFHETIADD